MRLGIKRDCLRVLTRQAIKLLFTCGYSLPSPEESRHHTSIQATVPAHFSISDFAQQGDPEHGDAESPQEKGWVRERTQKVRG